MSHDSVIGTSSVRENLARFAIAIRNAFHYDARCKLKKLSSSEMLAMSPLSSLLIGSCHQDRSFRQCCSFQNKVSSLKSSKKYTLSTFGNIFAAGLNCSSSLPNKQENLFFGRYALSTVLKKKFNII